MVPSVLYKYTSASVAELLLKNMSIRWSSPSLFKDLFEFQRMPTFIPDIKESYQIYINRIVDIVFGEQAYDNNFSSGTKLLIFLNQNLRDSGMKKEELLREISIPAPADQQRMTEILREHTEDQNYTKIARICCLTENYKNDVMWSHYADNNAGCVIGFKHLKELDTPFLAAKKVNYTSGPPVIGSAFDFLLYGNTPELRKKSFEAICFTKDTSWSYEEEWRTIAWRTPASKELFNDYQFYTEEVESLTFGSKINDKKKCKLSKLVNEKYPNCEQYEMTAEYGEYKRIKINV